MRSLLSEPAAQGLGDDSAELVPVWLDGRRCGTPGKARVTSGICWPRSSAAVPRVPPGGPIAAGGDEARRRRAGLRLTSLRLATWRQDLVQLIHQVTDVPCAERRPQRPRRVGPQGRGGLQDVRAHLAGLPSYGCANPCQTSSAPETKRSRLRTASNACRLLTVGH